MLVDIQSIWAEIGEDMYNISGPCTDSFGIVMHHPGLGGEAEKQGSRRFSSLHLACCLQLCSIFFRWDGKFVYTRYMYSLFRSMCDISRLIVRASQNSSIQVIKATLRRKYRISSLLS